MGDDSLHTIPDEDITELLGDNEAIQRQFAVAENAETIIAAHDEPPPAPTDEPDEPITKPQNAKLHAIFRQLGITNQTDRHLIRDHILGYHPETQLTKPEAHTLIDTTENWLTDQDYPAADRVNDILNQAALQAEAEQEDSDDN